MAVIEVSCGSFLNFRAGASSNIKVVSASSSLHLSQSEKNNPRPIRLSNDVRFQSAAVVSYGIYNGSVSHTLSFSHRTHPRTLLGIAESYLILGHVLKQAKYETPLHGLNLTHSATYTKGKGIYQALALSHTVGLRVIRSIHVSHDLGLQSYPKGYLMDKTFTWWPPITPPPPEDI
jgi:hypothetical protein